MDTVSVVTKLLENKIQLLQLLNGLILHLCSHIMEVENIPIFRNHPVPGIYSRLGHNEKELVEIASTFSGILMQYNTDHQQMLHELMFSRIAGRIQERYTNICDLLALLDKDSYYIKIKNNIIPDRTFHKVINDYPIASRYINTNIPVFRAIGNIANAFSGIRVNPYYVIVNDNRKCSRCGSTNINHDQETSTIICDNCNVVVIAKGEITAEEQMYNNNISYTKQKNHSELEHAQKWLDYILGKVDVVINDTDLRRIYQVVADEYRILSGYRDFSDMSCEYIRKKLKQLKLTKYNKYVVYIRGKVTEHMGNRIDPPFLNTDEIEFLIRQFDNVLTHIKKLKFINPHAAVHGQDPHIPSLDEVFSEEKNQHNIYYPYFWYKIIQSRLHRDPRRDAILGCIHIQSKSANVKREKLWEAMLQLPELSYMRIK